MVRFWSLDWAAAERAFLKALDFDASDANARHGYAFYLTTMGRLDEAIVADETGSGTGSSVAGNCHRSTLAVLLRSAL